MAKKRGVVLTFQEGVGRDKILEALNGMQDILDGETFKAIVEGRAIQVYDPRNGSPVWYIP